jgi:lysozyme
LSRTINAQGMELMKRLHVFRPNAVKNADGFLSIGYGHTRTAKEGQKIDQPEACRLLDEDMAIYADFVSKIVTVPLTENQFSSLTAFCAHISAAIFEKSNLVKLLNRGWYSQVPINLMKWGAKQNAIHRVRRAAEAQLWKTPDNVQESSIAA